MDDHQKAIAQAMYDIKPSMTGAMVLAAKIDELVKARIAEALANAANEGEPEQGEAKRGPGRPRKVAA